MSRASSRQNYVSALFPNALICGFAFELRYVHMANIQISFKKASAKRTSKGAVYMAFVAPSRPKNESVTDGPTDGGTHAPIESLRRD